MCLKERSAITIEPRISSTTDEAADFNSVRRVMDAACYEHTEGETSFVHKKEEKKRERERKRRVHRDSKLEGRLESSRAFIRG